MMQWRLLWIWRVMKSADFSQVSRGMGLVSHAVTEELRNVNEGSKGSIAIIDEVEVSAGEGGRHMGVGHSIWMNEDSDCLGASGERD
jgi:hypothetical protein